MATQWALAEVIDGVYYSERCHLILAAGGDCCNVHCPDDDYYDYTPSPADVKWAKDRNRKAAERTASLNAPDPFEGIF